MSLDKSKCPIEKLVKKKVKPSSIEIEIIQIVDNDYSEINVTTFKRSFSKLQRNYALDAQNIDTK